MAVRYRNLVYDSARWDGFAFRADDIVISTPPKAGTTLTQMMCALLVLQDPDLIGSIDELSPWLDMSTRSRDAVFARLEGQRHRRFIKTHTPLDGLPYDERVTYVCVARDPRDMALSWDNHLFNIDFATFLAVRAGAVGVADLAELAPGPPPEPPAELADRFWAYMDSPEDPASPSPNLASTVHHLATFFAVRDRPNVVLLHYADLTRDPAGQLRRLADRLGIAVGEDRWPALVEATRFDRMRERADRLAPESSNAIWRDNTRFFNRGTSGQWRTLLDAAGERRYAARVAELADPELLAWIHADASSVMY